MGEWKKVSMKDNLEILTGYAFSSKNFNEEEGIPLIRIRDLETHNPVTLYKGDYDDKYIINKGDILVGMDGEFNIVRWKGPKALLNQRVAKINSKNPDIISEDFIFYRLQGELRKIEALTPATTVKHLSKKDIEDLNLLLPPLGEQSKIASILSSVDEAIEKTEAIIEQTEKVKKGLMQQLLTKGIGHTKFKKTEIGEIPEEWEVKSFNDLLEMGYVLDIQDGNHGESHPKASDYVDKGIPFIMANNLVNGTLDLINCKFIKKDQADKLRIGFSIPGDVLLSHKGSIGKTAIVPDVEHYVMLTPQVTYYRVNHNFLSNKFLRYFFESDWFQRKLEILSAQSTRSYIGITNQKKLPMVLPTLDEQIKIVSIIESVERKLQNEILHYEQLQTIKKALMQVLLTGKVRVKVDDEVMSQ
ncbi:restriction endonuclease subunit S [Anoxybacillus kestanbolensis]|uniref:restriction endonuclease subunit S n=1 Tax=Anoxybacillus kestanbolensis TaxID=227476 RepID=UPI003D20FC50